MKLWDKDDIKILKDRYANSSNENLAEILYRTPQAIAIKAHKMGLKKSRIFLSLHGFQKGYIPFNKGRKMEEWLSPEVHAKIKANQARTADRNRAAAKPDGSVTKRYNGFYIRVSGKWVKLSHHVWVSYNGEIPEDYAVFFRDGNVFNTEIKNLYIDRKNNPTVILARKSSDERKAIAQKSWVVRHQKRVNQEARKNADLDHILSEIRKSNNNLYYKPNLEKWTETAELK